MGDRPLLGEVLVQAGLIDELQLARALGDQKRWGGRLGLALLRLGFVSENQLLETLSRQLGVPAVRLGSKRVPPTVLELLPAELAEKYRCLPLFVKREAGRELLHLGMEDPTDLAAIDDVSFRTGRRVRPVLVGPDELRRCLMRFYRDGEPLDDPVPESSGSSSPEAVAPAPLPPDDPTIVAATPVPDVAAPADPASPSNAVDEHPLEDDEGFVPEETLAQGIESAAQESGATASFAEIPCQVDPEPASEEPDPHEMTRGEVMSEADLPGSDPDSTLLADLDPGDALDLDDEASDEDVSGDDLTAPEASPHALEEAAENAIPPEDPGSEAVLLPLEDEEEAEVAAELEAEPFEAAPEVEPEPVSQVAPELEPEPAPEPAPISTRDVLRALTELLVEKEILAPSELLERVRATRKAADDA